MKRWVRVERRNYLVAKKDRRRLDLVSSENSNRDHQGTWLRIQDLEVSHQFVESEREEQGVGMTVKSRGVQVISQEERRIVEIVDDSKKRMSSLKKVRGKWCETKKSRRRMSC